MMHMTFYWGRKVTLLIDAWKTDTWTEYLLTLFACLLFSLFYQYMEDRRLRFKLLLSSPPNSLNNNNYSSSAAAAQPPSSARTPLLFPYSKVGGGGGRWNSARFAGAVLFGVNSAIGYLLMLAVMSFNGGVFVAIVVGLALGYLFFRSDDHEGGVVVLDNPCACA